MAPESDNKYALLTCEQRKEVLDMLEQLGSSLCKVAEHFGVGKSSIDRIRQNKGEVSKTGNVFQSQAREGGS